jgi:flagellar hook-associated protein 1 FlgK
MSLFSGLYVGASGLVTNQNALNTTAHNLSNIGTTGYTRQQTIQANKNYDTIGLAAVSPKQVGLGVKYADVRAVRDYFLDKAYRQEQGRAEYYTTNYNVITEMETLFGELQGVAFQDSLTELTRAVEELKKQPEDATNQGLLTSKAQTFLERAQAVYNGLAGYQDNINIQIKDNIDKINEYGDKIWELNQKIIGIETGGIERANDLRDARDQLLDELAALGKIAYDEDIDGVVTVQFEGVDFVTKDYVHQMGYIKGDEYNDLFAEDIEKGLKSAVDSSFYVPTWPMLKHQEVFSVTEDINSEKNTDIGALKALYNARGNKRGTYQDLYPTGKIVIDSKEYEPIKNETGHYNQIVTPEGKRYNVSDDGIVTEDGTGIQVGKLLTDAESINEFDRTTKRSSVMTVMAEFDNLIRGIVTGMNKILSSDGTPEGTSNDNLLFTRISDKSVPTGTDGWTTSNLMINPTVQKNPATMNNGFMLEDGSRDQYRADALVELFYNKYSALNPDTGTTLTFAGYYSALISENATYGKVYNSISTNQEAMVMTIDNQRQEVVGVSDSDELTQMIRYQNAYNASSRYINVINSMLDTLINAMT